MFIFLPTGRDGNLTLIRAGLKMLATANVEISMFFRHILGTCSSGFIFHKFSPQFEILLLD